MEFSTQPENNPQTNAAPPPFADLLQPPSPTLPPPSSTTINVVVNAPPSTSMIQQDAPRIPPPELLAQFRQDLETGSYSPGDYDFALYRQYTQRRYIARPGRVKNIPAGYNLADLNRKLAALSPGQIDLVEEVLKKGKVNLELSGAQYNYRFEVEQGATLAPELLDVNHRQLRGIFQVMNIARQTITRIYDGDTGASLDRDLVDGEWLVTEGDDGYFVYKATGERAKKKDGKPWKATVRDFDITHYTSLYLELDGGTLAEQAVALFELIAFGVIPIPSAVNFSGGKSFQIVFFLADESGQPVARTPENDKLWEHFQDSIKKAFDNHCPHLADKAQGLTFADPQAQTKKQILRVSGFSWVGFDATTGEYINNPSILRWLSKTYYRLEDWLQYFPLALADEISLPSTPQASVPKPLPGPFNGAHTNNKANHDWLTAHPITTYSQDESLKTAAAKAAEKVAEIGEGVSFGGSDHATITDYNCGYSPVESFLKLHRNLELLTERNWTFDNGKKIHEVIAWISANQNNPPTEFMITRPGKARSSASATYNWSPQTNKYVLKVRTDHYNDKGLKNEATDERKVEGESKKGNYDAFEMYYLRSRLPDRSAALRRLEEERSGLSNVAPESFTMWQKWGDFRKKKLPLPEWLIHGGCRGEVVMLWGPSKIGKSTIIRAFAQHASVGRAFEPLTRKLTGFEEQLDPRRISILAAQPKPLRVALLEWEGNDASLQMDLEIMSEMMELSGDEQILLDENLLALAEPRDGDGTPLKLTNKEGRLSLMFQSQVEAFRPDIIIVDSVTRACPVKSTNDNDEVEHAIMQPLREFARANNALVLFIHHTDKAGQNFRGAQAFEDYSAAVYSFLPEPGDVSQQVKVLENRKARGEYFEPEAFIVNARMRMPRRCPRLESKPGPEDRIAGLLAANPATGLTLKQVEEGIEKLQKSGALPKEDKGYSKASIKRCLSDGVQEGRFEKTGTNYKLAKSKPPEQMTTDDVLHRATGEDHD